MIKHGLKGTRFYRIWTNMKQRCLNPNHKSYIRYGKRGVSIIRSSFEEFRDDMYEKYLEHVEKHGEKNTSIDRINNDGHYCKENCRRATIKEQTENRKNYKVYTKNGTRIMGYSKLKQIY